MYPCLHQTIKESPVVLGCTVGDSFTKNGRLKIARLECMHLAYHAIELLDATDGEAFHTIIGIA